jgi:HEAT repeat protein
VTALSLVRQPTARSSELMRELVQAPSSGEVDVRATLGAGIMTRTLGACEPERARELASLLVRREEHATTVEQRRTLLEALGNAGVPETLSVACRYLDHADAGLRGSAVFALRFVQDARVEESIGRMLADPSARVRDAAAEALTYRATAESVAWLEKAARHADEGVRRRALRHFAGQVRSDPQALRVVRAIAGEDASPELRAEARAAIAGR